MSISYYDVMDGDCSMINQKICLKIKFERQKRGLSQEELALEAGLNRNTISKIETAQVKPTIETLEKLAKVFQMDIITLMDVSKVEL